MTNLNDTTPATETTTSAAVETALAKPEKGKARVEMYQALKSISAITTPKTGKLAAKRAAVEAGRAERMTKKLQALHTGMHFANGKERQMNMRATLIELLRAARAGATKEELASTGVATRFQWANIEEPVRVYCTAAGDIAAPVLDLLFPKAEAPADEELVEVEVVVEEADVAPAALVETPKSKKGKKGKKAA